MKTEFFFKIIVPNYNNAEWLEKSIGSILNQSFSDYFLIVVDDKSEDNSLEKLEQVWEGKANMWVHESLNKGFNGGTRNLGLRYQIPSRYTLFLDSDDWFSNNTVLQELHDFIVEQNYPDCVRLSYDCLIGSNRSPVILKDSSPQELVSSLYVVCWTKCIKSDLVIEFPENTLMEDVVQHIKQCDVLETVVPYLRSIITWNRNNRNSCSREENQDCQRGKWQSSMYRYMADLLDLDLGHDYCEEHRKWRAEVCLNNIKSDKYIQ